MSTAVPFVAAVRETTADDRLVGRWLVAIAVMVFAMIVVGGATRLTESGLSITEWKPVSGVLPPMSDQAWADEFAKYQQIPQYEKLNAGMTLEAFKRIYYWEYFHRLLARLVGMFVLVPFVCFVVRRKLSSKAMGPVLVVGALLALQAAMGWWMVSSGLTERTEVSHYRLTVHLVTALMILAMTTWTAASLLEVPTSRLYASIRGRRRLSVLAGMVLLTAMSGALVAGLRAGRIYNTFPLMGDRVVPVEYTQLSPWWVNLVENHAAVQFNHRLLAITTFIAVMTVWGMLRRQASPLLARRLDVMAFVALLQVGLGIATLLMGVPIVLGVAHQGGAALLLVTVLLALHAQRTQHRT